MDPGRAIQRNHQEINLSEFRTTSLPLLTSTRSGSDKSGDRAPTLEFFHSPSGDAFVDVHVAGHRETWAVRSPEFRRHIVSCAKGGSARSARIRALIDQAETYALRAEAPEREVYLRVAYADGCVYADIGDPKWRVVEVDSDSWRLVSNPPVRFLRAPGMLPLDLPERGGSLKSARSLFNLAADDDFLLLAIWLVTAFVRDHQQPILILRGGEGSAKSCLMNMLQSLVDPRRAAAIPFPNTEAKLLSAADAAYLLPFDNVSSLSSATSDALCRLVTGGRNQPIIVNGIGNMATRPDLADRAIFLDLGTITDERRRSLSELTAEFVRLRPKILGAIFDAIVCGLRNLSQTKLIALPRMADFAIFAAACETPSWPAGSFASAYHANRADAAERLLGSDPVASSIRTFAAKRGTWTGTATELDGILRALSGNTDNTSGWPAEPRLLAIRLREIAASLAKVGVGITFAKAPDRSRARLVTIAATAPNQVPTGTRCKDVPAPASAPSEIDQSSNIGPGEPRRAVTVPSTPPEPAEAVADAADARKQAGTIRQSTIWLRRTVLIERGTLRPPETTSALQVTRKRCTRPTLSLPKRPPLRPY
jgi:hypothetical protein